MASPKDNPPGPLSRLPLGLSYLFKLLNRPLDFLQEVAAYGDIAYFKLGKSRVYILNQPDYIREVLVNKAANFDKSKNVRTLKKMLGEGLLTSEGEYHLRQRRLLQPIFHRKLINIYAQTIPSYAVLHSNRHWKSGQNVDMFQEMTRLTMAVLTKTVFNTDIETNDPLLEQALQDIIEWSKRNMLPLPLADLLESLPLPSTRRFNRARKYLDNKITQIVQECRSQSQPQIQNLVSTLLTNYESENDPFDSRFSLQQQVRDELVTLFMAGHGTTALALSWTWYLLATHQEVQVELHAELDRVLAGRLPNSQDLKDLVYTQQILMEALRLYPPAYVLIRNAKTTFELAGYTIPAGSFVIPSPYVIQHNKLYFANPDNFDPHRWTDEFNRELPKFAYFPFGGGPRVCIGEPFAWMESVLVLAVLAQRWKVSLAPHHQVQAKPLLTLRFKNGLPLTIEARSPDNSF